MTMLAKALDIGDWAGLLAAVAALGTLVVYLKIARYAVKQVDYAKKQLDLAECIRLEEARPYVVAEFLVERHLIEFRLRNIGATMAKSVTFTWDQFPQSSKDNSMWSRPTEIPFFRDGIASLAPNQEIRAFFDSFVDRVALQLPMVYTITLNYQDSKGGTYEESSTLDLKLRLSLEHVRVYTIHDVAEQLSRIASAMGQD